MGFMERPPSGCGTEPCFANGLQSRIYVARFCATETHDLIAQSVGLVCVFHWNGLRVGAAPNLHEPCPSHSPDVRWSGSGVLQPLQPACVMHCVKHLAVAL